MNRSTTAALHFARGRIYRRQAQWEEALAAFQRAQELDPLNADRRTAAVLMWMRRYEKAIEDYDGIIEMAPDFEQCLPAERVDALALEGKHAGGAEDARGASGIRAQHAHSVGLVLAAGSTKGAIGRLSRGSTSCRTNRCSASTSFSQPKPLLKGQVLALMDEPELARAAYEEARLVLEAEKEKHPDDANVRQALAIAYAGLGMKEGRPARNFQGHGHPSDRKGALLRALRRSSRWRWSRPWSASTLPPWIISIQSWRCRRSSRSPGCDSTLAGHPCTSTRASRSWWQGTEALEAPRARRTPNAPGNCATLVNLQGRVESRL